MVLEHKVSRLKAPAIAPKSVTSAALAGSGASLYATIDRVIVSPFEPPHIPADAF